MSERLILIFPALALLFAGHLALQNFGAAVLPGMLAASLLVLVLAAAAGSGRILLRAFGARDLSESEKTLIGATLGLGVLSQAMLVLGAVGAFRTWAVSVLMSALWVVGFTELRDVARSLGANRNLLRERPLATGGVLALLGLSFLACWVPPHQYDALVYHLALPAAYIREGRIVAPDHLLYSHFPQNAEMLYGIALLLGSDLLAQLFTWLGSFLSVWWMFELGKREMPTSAALGACLLASGHTALMLLSGTAYVEPLVMLWITASVLSFLRWREHSSEDGGARGWLALSAAFAGLGVGTKYYAGICPALLALWLLARWAVAARHSEDPAGAYGRGKDLALFAGLASACGAPWLVKNLLVLGNPVFPFLYRQLPAHGVEWSGEAARRYFEIMTEYGHGKGHFLSDLVQFPYLAAAGSTRFGGGADVLGDLGWGLFFLAAPLAFWAAWKNRYLRWMTGYCAAHWAVWFSTGVVLRFLTVLIPLLSLLSAYGLYQAWGRLGALGRGALGTALAIMGAVNLGLFVYVHALTGSPTVLVGLRGRQAYLSGLLDYYPCARHAAESLPADAGILLVGEQRGYFVEQRHTATTVMAPNRFVREADESAGPGELAGRLKARGWDYLLFVPREAARLGEYGIFDFTPKGRANWAALEKERLRTVFESPGRCALYQVAG